jgi:hypothetical protein
MGTDIEDRIKQNISIDEYNKLDSIIMTICNFSKSIRRPDDFPNKPRVALIAGNLAGRGISIQNPFIDFVCTSFCFTDTRDILQCGATNAQRFGRACGMLKDIYLKSKIFPIIIATEGIMQDSIANEIVLKEKAEKIKNGSLISLKDLISKQEWDNIIKKTKEDIKIAKQDRLAKKIDNSDKIDGVELDTLYKYFKSKNLLIGKMLRYLYKINYKISIQDFKNNIKYTKSDEQFLSNIKNGLGINCQYGQLWKYENDEIQINQNIKIYLDKIQI